RPSAARPRTPTITAMRNMVIARWSAGAVLNLEDAGETRGAASAPTAASGDTTTTPSPVHADHLRAMAISLLHAASRPGSGTSRRAAAQEAQYTTDSRKKPQAGQQARPHSRQPNSSNE